MFTREWPSGLEPVRVLRVLLRQRPWQAFYQKQSPPNVFHCSMYSAASPTDGLSSVQFIDHGTVKPLCLAVGIQLVDVKATVVVVQQVDRLVRSTHDLGDRIGSA